MKSITMGTSQIQDEVIDVGSDTVRSQCVHL